ncbi:MAG: hypothetical protein H7258_13775, partial [Ferruginibacter sp.]|nr:hypothetical protein [Ferruginibacter sp.]
MRLNPDGSRDLTFNVGTGVNGIINTLVLQTDGKIIAGGKFTTFNGVVSNHIVRLTTTGSRDAAFTGNIANSVADLAIQSNGSIIVGINNDGDSLVSNFIKRLTSTGAVDATFNVGGTGANGSVKTIFIQPDGKIIFGGEFTSYNTTNCSYTRITPNGLPDATFTNNAVYASPVNNIALQADGKILLSWGEYITITRAEGIRVARLNTNGTNDPALSPEMDRNLDHNISSVVVQPDGKLLIAESIPDKWSTHDRYGSFFGRKVLFSTRNFKINRYLANGARDQNFCISPLQKAANRTINSLNVQADGKVIIGGSFYNYNGTSSNYLARVNSDGSKDAGFNAGGTGPDSYIYTAALQADGKILVGGMFMKYNGMPDTFLIRLNINGSRDNSFHFAIPSSGGVKSLAIQPDGKIMVGGFAKVVRLNIDGSIDNSFNVTIYANYGVFFPYIETIAIQTDGKLIVGGSFSGISGPPGLTANLVRLNTNGSVDGSFSSSLNTNDVVKSGALQTDGKILIGGYIDSYLRRLNTDGSNDASFNPGGTGLDINLTPVNFVTSIVVQPDNKIMVAGNFRSYNNVTTNGILRLNADGTLDNVFNPGAGGVTQYATVVGLLNGGSKIYLAGSIT